MSLRRRWKSFTEIPATLMSIHHIVRGLDHKLNFLIRRHEMLTDKLHSLVESMQAQTTLIAGLSQMITTLKGQVAGAIASAGDLEQANTLVDQVFTMAEQNKVALHDALVANTTAEAVTVPEAVVADTPTEVPVITPVITPPGDAPVGEAAPETPPQ